MPLEPEIKSLSHKKRSYFFYVLFIVFLISLPLFIFYTTGYRLNFDNDRTSIVTTGGIYVTTNNLDVDVYMDEKKVEQPRLFRSAYYIQNIETGLHRVVVQKNGLQTWVKIIPVDSYIVTEASAFNMPEIPYIRPIAQYTNAGGQGVYISKATTTDLFPKATTTGSNFVIVPKATGTLQSSSEYKYVAQLFASSTASSTSIINKLEAEIQKFRFSSSTNASTSKQEIKYIEHGNMRLIPRGDELYAHWIGSAASTPYYFCTADSASTTVALRYGEHFAKQIEMQRLSTTTPLLLENNRLCRFEIRLDRKWQHIKYYEFFPNSSDLVVMQLEDGLYVTEIDDRAWQNTQMIYPGDKFETIVTDTNIYIKEDGRFFELRTKIPAAN